MNSTVIDRRYNYPFARNRAAGAQDFLTQYASDMIDRFA
jgi:hypothetical protein